MSRSKMLLATLWFVWSGVLFLVFILQTILGAYSEEGASEAWGWFLPTVMPTLSLIGGVLVLDALGKGLQKRTVNRFLFRLTLGSSAVYLLFVTLTILLQPFASAEPLELMQQSNLWLSPIQGW